MKKIKMDLKTNEAPRTYVRGIFLFSSYGGVSRGFGGTLSIHKLKRLGYCVGNNKTRGFALIELLVVATIMIILAVILVIIVNPVELLRSTRDSVRLADLRDLNQAIQGFLDDAPYQPADMFCYDVAAPCVASSFPQNANTFKNDGTGWVKMNFSNGGIIFIQKLPVDPVNDGNFNYTYFSDGQFYEINAVLESTKYRSRMSIDGGNNPDAYEMGTNLDLM